MAGVSSVASVLASSNRLFLGMGLFSRRSVFVTGGFDPAVGGVFSGTDFGGCELAELVPDEVFVVVVVDLVVLERVVSGSVLAVRSLVDRLLATRLDADRLDVVDL